MIKSNRSIFNKQFSNKKYEAIHKDIYEKFNYKPAFKIAETPVFIPRELKTQLLDACEEIMKVINRPDFKSRTEEAFYSPEVRVPNEVDKPTFIQIDFGICLDENGELIPKLIELQGFPSLYFFQELLARMYRKHYDIPQGFSIHPNGYTTEQFLELLKREIVGDTDPKQVILLEIEPEKQATAIDFYATHAMLGIKILCISKLIKRGKDLFYNDEQGNEVRVLKIYNRIIFDELYQRGDLKREFYFVDEVNVEWIGHPNWFFRISKYMMPLLKSKYVPKTYLLDGLELPEDLENYVLKPLYSFAGTGVHLDVTLELIEGLINRSNYILQEKVQYHPVVETLDEPAKCEIRMMLLKNSKENKYEIVSNLVRLSKGKMIGVKYNKDKTWVGGSTGFFEL